MSAADWVDGEMWRPEQNAPRFDLQNPTNESATRNSILSPSPSTLSGKTSLTLQAPMDEAKSNASNGLRDHSIPSSKYRGV